MERSANKLASPYKFEKHSVCDENLAVSEQEVGFNFNPSTCPWPFLDGVRDTELDDVYSSEIRGLSMSPKILNSCRTSNFKESC